MGEQDRAFSRNIEQLVARGDRASRRGQALAMDRTLQVLVADLVAARTAASMTQQDVADRMRSTRSAVSRLESGQHTRPTLSTIGNYAQAVGAIIEIRVRTRR